MRSQNQLARLLNLVPFLQQHQGVSVADAAAAFDATPRELLGDLEVLQYCGLPEGLYDDLFDVDLEGARSDGTIFFRNADVLARPMRLRSSEATSLLIALQALVDLSGGSEAATSALAKLRGALGGADPAIRVEIEGGDAEHRRLLQDAICGRRVVRLQHRGSGRAAASEPVVEPGQLRLVDGVTYLDGWSRLRDDWRSFRLDRLDGVTILDETFEQRPGMPDMADWFAGASQLRLGLGPAAGWVAEYFPTSEVAHRPDGLDVTFPVATSDWATALLLRLGDDVQHVDDPAIARAAAEEARAALDLYR